MNVVGIIPARGGSKAVPLKNVKLLAGRPLLTYTIVAAQSAATIDRIVVSTDHEAIAAVARESGAEVVQRPAELATDTASTEAALLHAVDTLGAAGYAADLVVTLEPTSPLRTAALIDRCVAALAAGRGDSVLTVTETRDCLGRLVDGHFEHLVKGQPRRRQDREPLYRETSTVYVTRVDVLRRRHSVLGECPYAVVVDPTEAVDINVPLDFVVAEAIVRWRNGVKEVQ